jgi:hypothetical protein
MGLLNIFFVLIIAGIILWLIDTYVPMAKPIKTIINIIAVFVIIIWLLKVFGLFSYLTSIHI